MKSATISTPLRPVAIRAVKSPPLRFEGKHLTDSQGKNKQGRFKFSIFKLMMLTGAVASGFAVKTHNDQLEQQQIAFDIQHRRHVGELEAYHDFSTFRRLSKNSPLYPPYPSADWASNALYHQLFWMGWDSARLKKVPNGESAEFIYCQHEEALDAINADESFLKSHNYPFSQATLKKLYQRYLTRPDSERTLKETENTPSELKISPETLKTLKAEYPEYAKAIHGKQNPISMDEFSMMVDIYRFFCDIQNAAGDKGSPEAIFQRYTETVLAKHAESPKLPFVKPYYEKAKAGLKHLAHDKKQIRNIVLKEVLIKGVDILFLLGFIVALHVPGKSKIDEEANP